jgi:hypothetical protein
MNLTLQEVLDLQQACIDAQEELCVDLEGNRYPQATAYYRRLEALIEKLKDYGINHT